ncbi:putative protein OS=Tsukamurella paurometabola (strain ATCC 8368 / DSM / CCUG 35730 /CIP 100753 / JCM 10117 / KCTC 9821 / NBRC 16120 / NCIMB 702349/ NCTC 13040) OX=521096 GN=Tpau_2278 PE=4 SV=1 [Tsukamurella paurometabola]|uniref:Uncharacterized protein n=1 Tax=Tsukamurella paurometabola (strain ATCC 8368 / DSM 20162 / CCUG 35730 / CIP 100753 / JCM 10117 / KCTC 9821 / NBRC 16120 / NCIMB 702349 / NCTC 13040) TaxID=521096 RepID=D5UQB6_TSUPD|nr:hypothetical protein [Tsukamurella paurometabola]ADG78886.1 hypothetical protein Tpau_2278 [Tsukamurella paurometabola DSM 20162]SUP33421.1 Uncharacterised protein [Tsukamurella paurometabola]
MSLFSGLISQLTSALRGAETASENLVHVFGGSATEARLRGYEWAVTTLRDAEVSAAQTPVRAVRELRRHNRALSLLGAKTLVDEVVARG